MLNENMKDLGKRKGLTQDELAIRLHVVRQTVSKWEKGISVPDAVMLQKIAEVFEVDVSELLGSPIQQNESTDIIAEQLARINAQLVVKNNRSRKIWKTVGITLAVLFAVYLLLVVLSFSTYQFLETDAETYEVYAEEFVAD